MTAALLLGLGDLAGDDQLPVLELDVYPVPVHCGQVDLDHVGVVGLGHVGERDPGPFGHVDGGQAEGEVHQLTHASTTVRFRPLLRRTGSIAMPASCR